VIRRIGAGDCDETATWPGRVYTGSDTRAFSLLLGAMVATQPVRHVLARMTGGQASAVLVALAAGLGVMWVFVDGVDSPWLFEGGLFAHSLAAALLVGLCVQAPHAVVAKLLAGKPLRGLGLISYSLYLWHWPVLALLSPHGTANPGWGKTAVVFASSIGLATLSKHLIEDPIRFRARWARGRRGLLAFTALTLALAGVWLLVPAPAPVTIDITGLD
jgi:peptidoglycan/LPS O-acetylase OafA/YrhL